MQRTTSMAALSVLALLAVACSPDSSPTAVPHDSSPAAIREHGVIPLGRYLAMGTSISMGVQGDGVIAATQETSWPAQFANLLRLPFTQPYFDGTGCRSPLRAPLASGIRLSGEGAGQDLATLSCLSLRADVELPVQNVAINAARTSDALFTTPENITDAGYVQLYRRVLNPGQTQVSTMLALDPDFVSVEFGGNEVLNERSGIAIVGATMVPLEVWAPLYHQLLDSVESTAKRAVLVGLIRDVATFPAFRPRVGALGRSGDFPGRIQRGGLCQLRYEPEPSLRAGPCAGRGRNGARASPCRRGAVCAELPGGAQHGPGLCTDAG